MRFLPYLSCLILLAAGPLVAQPVSTEKQRALEEAQALAPEIRRMSMELWKYSETALREDRSADLLTDVLEAEGFAVERGVAGMPTAFVASYGRSALDAVEMMNYGVNMMREHIQPTARIHYEAPNVVPEYAKVWYYVRELDRKRVEEYYNWILKIAEAAAMATRTEHKVFLVTGVHEYNLNRPLQEVVQANLELVGPPVFAEDEQAFARELQAFLEIEEKGYNTEIEPLADEPEPASGGSTDVAEVSYITPTVGFRVATAAADVPWHSWATSACHGTEAGVKGAHVAAQVIAATGIDVMTDPDLRARAKAFFLEQTGGESYKSPIPLDQAPPLPNR